MRGSCNISLNHRQDIYSGAQRRLINLLTPRTDISTRIVSPTEIPADLEFTARQT